MSKFTRIAAVAVLLGLSAFTTAAGAVDVTADGIGWDHGPATATAAAASASAASGSASGVVVGAGSGPSGIGWD